MAFWSVSAEHSVPALGRRDSRGPWIVTTLHGQVSERKVCPEVYQAASDEPRVSELMAVAAAGTWTPWRSLEPRWSSWISLPHLLQLPGARPRTGPRWDSAKRLGHGCAIGEGSLRRLFWAAAWYHANFGGRWSRPTGVGALELPPRQACHAEFVDQHILQFSACPTRPCPKRRPRRR